VYDISTFDLPGATLAGARIRALGEGHATLEGASAQVARFFYDAFATSRIESAFVLVRCYLTQPLGALPPDLAKFARDVVRDQSLDERTPCFTLLSSYGDAPDWRSRRNSKGHRVIPLSSEQVLRDRPMIARLLVSMGLEARDLLHPTPDFILDRNKRGFGVFYVEEARGSHYVPAQDFVITHEVRSVFGFGFLLPPANVFFVILFCRLRVTEEQANLFNILALNLKLALLPLSRAPVLEEPHP
jgi:two-component system NtrC family sensor kinase